MKAGIVLLLGAAVVVFYLMFNTSQANGPLASQQGSSVLRNLFGLGNASGTNPSPLTNRSLLPANYVLPQTSQSPVGVAAQAGAGAAAFASALVSIFRGNPAQVPSTSQQASGTPGQPISNATGGLLQGPTASGTPLSVSAGWQPTDSVIDNVDLQPPPDQSLSSGVFLISSNSPLLNATNTDLSSGVPDSFGPISDTYPGYDSTVPVDTGVVSLPDATTPDTVLV